MRTRSIRGVCVGLAALALAACGGSGPSRAEFQADVQDARNRVDSSLEEITRAQSKDELLQRMDSAALVISRAADDLDDAGAAKGFDDEAGALVNALHGLAADLTATADQIREPGFESLLEGTRGLSFENWTKANAVLVKLRDQGLQVEPLARH